MKISYILTFLLISSMSFGQIKKVETEPSELIGKIGSIGETWLKLEKSGDVYTFTYKDMKYTQLTDFKSFSFIDEDNAFEDLYNIILKGLDEVPSEPIMLEIPNGYLWLEFGKTLGKPFVTFSHSVGKSGDVIGKSTWMNRKKLDKVFGKK